MATLLLLGTLDTKGLEFGYVRDLVRSWGHEVVLVDAGVAGEPRVTPDIPAARVAEAGGLSLDALRALGDRGRAMEVMSAGLRSLVAELHAAGAFQAVMGVGGGGGAALAAAAMQDLPVGLPKLIVSTMASGDTRPYVGVKDVAMLYPVVDVAGLNPISRRILANGAAAICGMMERPVAVGSHRPLIAATMFGVTTPCVDRVRGLLDDAGYDVLVFHATGMGGRAMEGLIEAGFFAAVADLTTTEWCDEVVGGVLSAGPDRLAAAGRAGVPQVVSIGACDMVNFGPFETVPEGFRGRKLYRHNASVTLMRTTPQECAEIGKRIARQLNGARGPTTVLVPLGGVSALDAPGQPFHDPAANAALVAALKEHLHSVIEIVEVEHHINDPRFAEVAAERLLRHLAVPAPEILA